MTKILHYLNQFFAGIGGEDKAGQEFLFLPKAVGPGVVLCDLLKNHEVEYATVVCGDNYFHEHEEASSRFFGGSDDPVCPGPVHCRSGFSCGKIRTCLRQNGQLRARALEHTGGDGSL